MTDAPEPVPAHAMFKVLAALAELGEDTAAAVADKAGLGYSTATAKLRAWEKTGQAERVHTDSKRAVWRLTDAGRATVGADQAPPPAQDGAPDEPADPACHDDPAEIADTPAGPEVTPTPNPATPAGGETPPPADDPAAPPDGEAVEAIAADAGGDRRAAASEDGPDTVTPATQADPPAASSRRTKGSLRGAVLDILEAHPDQAYKTGELCKLVDAANAGTDAKKVSAGAVVNAADKLVETGKAVRTVEKPATFQLAPAAR